MTSPLPNPLVSLWRRLRRALAGPAPEPARPPARPALPPPPPWLTPEYLAALRSSTGALHLHRWQQAFNFYNAHHEQPLRPTRQQSYGHAYAFLASVLTSYLPPPR